MTLSDQDIHKLEILQFTPHPLPDEVLPVGVLESIKQRAEKSAASEISLKEAHIGVLRWPSTDMSSRMLYKKTA